MRRRHRVFVLAAFVAAVAVPLGFALSLESSATPSVAVHQQAPDVSDIGDITIVAATSTKPHLALMTSPPANRGRSAIPDAVKLLFVGSALFALAAVMRVQARNSPNRKAKARRASL